MSPLMNTVVHSHPWFLADLGKWSLSAPMGVWWAFLCWIDTISLGWVGGIPSVFANLPCRNGWYKCWQTPKWLSGQPPWCNHFLPVCSYCRTALSQSLCLWLPYLSPCLPSPLQKRDLSLEDRTESWFCANGLQIPNHELYLLWLIPPSWECFCGSAFVNLLSVGSAGFARSQLLVPALNYFLIQLVFLIGRVLQEPSSRPKWGKEKEFPMIPPPAAVISAFILNMLTVWWWCVEPFI